VLAAGTP